MKTIKLMAACCLTLCLFASCGGITVKGENGQEYESYQECCAALDFMAAHTFLAKMEAKIDGDKIKKEEYETAKEYIFKQEALYLMSIGDDVAKKRISYLLKEEGGNDSHVAMLIDLAIDNDDEDFVKILVNQLKKPSGERIAKVATYLTRKSDSGNNDYVFTLINGISLKGKKPRPGIIGYYEDGLGDYKDFQKSVTSFNGICDKILDVAINNKNRDLALSILALYKEDIGMFTGGSSIKVKGNWYDKAPDGTLVDGNHRYIWFYNKSKTDAKKKYDEAVKSGAFK